MEARLRKDTIVDRPIEQVWPLVAELDSELRWRAPWVVSLENLDDGPVAPGSRIRGTTRVAGSTDTYVNEVTELDPPRRYAWRGVEVSGPVIGHGSYELEPLDGGRTRVTLAALTAAATARSADAPAPPRCVGPRRHCRRRGR